VNDVSNSDLICAVDLGGTNLRAANVDHHGLIHERFKCATVATQSAEQIVAAIAAAVRQCEAAAIARGMQIRSVSVVVPGSVQLDTGVVINAPNLPSLAGFAFAPALNNALGDRVLLENDANAAALGEMWQGAARDCRTIICLTLGTGVGSGIILNGQLWRGVDGLAGELGHTSVEPFGGVHCKCGNFGCLEVYASATAIVRLTLERLLRHPDSILNSIASELSSEKIFKSAKDEDELAIEVFRTMGTYLGVAMASFINIFNPEMIVIGGGVAASWEMFAEQAKAEVMKRAFAVSARRCRIERAESGDDAGLLGAAWLALENKARRAVRK
jgi:glucokinase